MIQWADLFQTKPISYFRKDAEFLILNFALLENVFGETHQMMTLTKNRNLCICGRCSWHLMTIHHHYDIKQCQTLVKFANESVGKQL